ncbi:MAG: transglycosylase SLT domain-containing protein [Alphaproteobacteria bacterium]|nr:transglycosylase SLT domain-containing protein [Alphaproteobacteria bacterium]
MLESNNIINVQSTAHLSSKGRVIAAIKAASLKSGVDFAYLLNEANQESSLNPTAKASSSSATGLYQFIDQTWLKTMKTAGDKYGLGDLANKISVGSDGVARVANAADKKAILALRHDPKVSSYMAAELAKANKATLEQRVGGDIGSTELYMAHFLGANGAALFLDKLKENPNAKAADYLPTAAGANKSVFYDQSTGRARTVKEIYAKFAAKFETVPDLGGEAVSVASVSPSAPTSALPQSFTIPEPAYRLAELAGTSSSSSPSFSSLRSISYPLAETNAPFTTMLLAQMDMENLGLKAQESMMKVGQNDQARRKALLETIKSIS